MICLPRQVQETKAILLTTKKADIKDISYLEKIYQITILFDMWNVHTNIKLYRPAWFQPGAP